MLEALPQIVELKIKKPKSEETGHLDGIEMFQSDIPLPLPFPSAIGTHMSGKLSVSSSDGDGMWEDAVQKLQAHVLCPISPDDMHGSP